MPTDTSSDQTELGNYFIANYPPFSFWKAEHLGALERLLETPPSAAPSPLGLYLHIPFCRKRCKFCYFRVYTDVNAEGVQGYVDALAAEVTAIARQPAVEGRPIQFVYFGGGTPSYLSVRQLHGLVARIREHLAWDRADEVTFECEPGTLTEPKLQALREIGVSRLSLGIENFDDAILEENGRAHHSREIYRSWEWIRAIGFEQVNIDLIAGMVGETWENWNQNIQKTVELAPECITIYQMELPYNTRYSKDLAVLGHSIPVANWSTKRAWLDHAMDELLAAGYEISSAYTMVRRPGEGGRPVRFVYRDSLWRGADLLGTGVASFGHLGGVHYQNVDGLEEYLRAVEEGRLPLGRALPVTSTERAIREMVLQMKLGWLDAAYFRQKFGWEIFEEFAQQFADLQEQGWGTIEEDRFELTRQGLLCVDALLPAFFLPQHRTPRYT